MEVHCPSYLGDWSATDYVSIFVNLPNLPFKLGVTTHANRLQRLWNLKLDNVFSTVTTPCQPRSWTICIVKPIMPLRVGCVVCGRKIPPVAWTIPFVANIFIASPIFMIICSRDKDTGSKFGWIVKDLSPVVCILLITSDQLAVFAKLAFIWPTSERRLGRNRYLSPEHRWVRSCDGFADVGGKAVFLDDAFRRRGRGGG